MEPVERVGTIRGMCASQTGDSPCQVGDFRHVSFACDLLVIVYSEKEGVLFCTREFQATHGQAGGAVAVLTPRYAFNGGKSFQPALQFGTVPDRSCAAWVQAGIEVGVIARIDAVFETIGMMNEDSIACSGAVQVTHPVTGAS